MSSLAQNWGGGGTCRLEAGGHRAESQTRMRGLWEERDWEVRPAGDVTFYHNPPQSIFSCVHRAG